MRKQWNLPALGLFAAGVVVFELAVRSHLLPEFLFPAPTKVLKTLFENGDEFRQRFFETTEGAAVGLFFSILCGVSLAVLFSLSRFLRRAVLPFAVFFQTVPIIAVAPLLVIYFGFGLPTVTAAAFLVSLFPMIANTLLGLESVDPALLDLFRLYGASPWQILMKLRLPSAYASIYSGLKIATGLAIIGAIAGEFVAGGGLGSVIDSARTQQRIDLVFAALLLLAAMGMAGMGLLKLLHKGMQKIRPYGIHLKDEA